MPLSLRALGAASVPAAFPAMLLSAAPAQAASIPPPPTKKLPTALDIAPSYQAGTRCLTKALPGPVDFAKLLNAHYGTHVYGILRPCAAEHGEGRALDWMVNANTKSGLALGNAITTWLTAKDAQGRPGAMARRFGINYIIWNRHMWRSYDPGRGWAAYTGSSPHTDHIHISFTWDGAYEQTSWWTGKALLQVKYTGPIGDPSSPVVTDSPAITNTGYPHLVRGATGAFVTLAQQVVGTPADGDYGPKTQAAVLAWQTAHGVAATGELDYDTWLAMVRLGLVPSRASKSPLYPYRGVTLKVGSSGAAVKALQSALGGLTVDGQYGPLTQSKVKAYQKANRLTVTGVVTSEVWNSLMGVAAATDPTPTDPTPTDPTPTDPTPTDPTPEPTPTPRPKVTSSTPASAVLQPPMTTEFTSAKSVILKRGNRGQAVRVLETGLGFRTRDRVFDADTEAAVRAFQKSEHLPVTGIVNRATWDALERRAHPLVDYWKTVLRPGATGPAVVAVQTALGVPADGVYGREHGRGGQGVPGPIPPRPDRLCRHPHLAGARRGTDERQGRDRLDAAGVGAARRRSGQRDAVTRSDARRAGS